MKHPLPVTLTVLPALRQAGIRIQIRHRRVFGIPSDDCSMLYPYRRKMKETVIPVNPHGGETTVQLTFPDGGFYTGVAKCSLDDRFDRREGIRIALDRALFARKAYKSKHAKGTLTLTSNSISVS